MTEDAMYYLQEFCPMDRVWERPAGIGFEDLLSALERRDKSNASRRPGCNDAECRVVDDDGTAYEYTTETVSPRFE